MIKFNHLPVIMLVILFYIPIFIKLKKAKATTKKHILAAAFYVYIVKVIDVAFFPIFIHGDFDGIVVYNLIPLRTIIGTLSTYAEYGGFSKVLPILYNILMFMPMGYLLPLVTKNISSTTKVLLLCIGISCFIETVQLLGSWLYSFTWRHANVDDIILNSIGAIVGFFLLRCSVPILKKYDIFEVDYVFPASHVNNVDNEIDINGHEKHAKTVI